MVVKFYFYTEVKPKKIRIMLALNTCENFIRYCVKIPSLCALIEYKGEAHGKNDAISKIKKNWLIVTVNGFIFTYYRRVSQSRFKKYVYISHLHDPS